MGKIQRPGSHQILNIRCLILFILAFYDLFFDAALVVYLGIMVIGAPLTLPK